MTVLNLIYLTLFFNHWKASIGVKCVKLCLRFLLTVLSPGRSKIKGLRFRQVNVRKSTLIEQTLFCKFNLIFETAANWGWVGELKYLRPWNTIDRTANVNTLGIYWTVRESNKMHTTLCSYHFWTLLFWCFVSGRLYIQFYSYTN